MDGVALVEQKLGKVRAVLARDPGDECRKQGKLEVIKLGMARVGFNTKTRRDEGLTRVRWPRNDAEVQGNGKQGDWRAGGSPQRTPRARRLGAGNDV
jgi:hypothetical protein